MIGRIGLLADVHVGNHRVMGGPVEAGLNRRCRQVLQALRCGVEKAFSCGCSDLVILGDLFDTDTVSPQIVAATQRALTLPGLNVTVLTGNHDQRSTVPGDHALGPLVPIVGLTVVDTVRVIDDDIYVPFRPGPVRQWLPEVLGQLPVAEYRYMFIHTSLVDDYHNPYIRAAHDAIHVNELFVLVENLRLQGVFAGNLHTRTSWYGTGACFVRDQEPWRRTDAGGVFWPRVVQVGALCPADFGDTPPFGALLVVGPDDGTMEIHDLRGPRFFTTDSLWKLHQASDQHLAGYPTYIRFRCKPDVRTTAVDTLGRMKEAGTCEDAEVETDASEGRQRAQQAAEAAAKTETLDAAVDVYTGRMGMVEVDRIEVAERIRNYLRR